MDTSLQTYVDIQLLQSLLQAIAQIHPNPSKRLLHVFPLYSSIQRLNAETEAECAHNSLQEMHVHNELGVCDCVYLGNIITYVNLISYIDILCIHIHIYVYTHIYIYSIQTKIVG